MTQLCYSHNPQYAHTSNYCTWRDYNSTPDEERKQHGNLSFLVPPSSWACCTNWSTSSTSSIHLLLLLLLWCFWAQGMKEREREREKHSPFGHYKNDVGPSSCALWDDALQMIAARPTNNFCHFLPKHNNVKNIIFFKCIYCCWKKRNLNFLKVGSSKYFVALCSRLFNIQISI